MKIMYKLRFCFFILILFFYINCTGQQHFKSPKGYDLTRPVKYNMPESLLEISGITFDRGNADILYAEQDENGELFYFKPGNKNTGKVKFEKDGDYEDVTICNGTVIMLRSDGTLFTFLLTDIKKSEITNVRKQNGLLPDGEYEGMYADYTNNSVYVLCKHCSTEKSSKTCTVYEFTLSGDGSLKKSGEHTIDVGKISELTKKPKISFHPSGLAQNPATHNWFVLSSVNKLLVVTDQSWNVKEVYDLDPVKFIQPEGIAFDKENNLYISNEGDKLQPGNVLKFLFKP